MTNRMVVCIMIVVILLTNLAKIRTEDHVVLFLRRWQPYSQRYLLVGLVGLVRLVLWLGSVLALNKYRSEHPDNDDVKWLVVHIMGMLRV